jgi:hypothetical protein
LRVEKCHETEGKWGHPYVAVQDAVEQEMNHQPKRNNDGAYDGEVVELRPQFLKNAIFIIGEPPHLENQVQDFGISFL